jgi:hypothetical protein
VFIVLPLPGSLVLIDPYNGEVLGGARVGYPYAYLGFASEGSNVTLLLIRDARDPLFGRDVVTFRVDYGSESWYNASLDVPPDSRSVATDWGVWVPGFPGIQLYSYDSRLLGAVALNSSATSIGGVTAYVVGGYTVLGVFLLDRGPVTLVVDRGLSVVASIDCTPADSRESPGGLLILCASSLDESSYRVTLYSLGGEGLVERGSTVIESSKPPALALLAPGEPGVLLAALVSAEGSPRLQVVDVASGSVIDQVDLGELGFIADSLEWDPYTGLKSIDIDGDGSLELVVTVVELTLSPITHVIAFEYG